MEFESNSSFPNCVDLTRMTRSSLGEIHPIGALRAKALLDAHSARLNKKTKKQKKKNLHLPITLLYPFGATATGEAQ